MKSGPRELALYHAQQFAATPHRKETRNMAETKAPKKRVPPAGTRSLHITIAESLYAKIEQTADGRPINDWLSRLIERNAKNFPELAAPMVE